MRADHVGIDLLWTHYHGTVCRIFEPALHIRPATPSSIRTTALWTCLNAAREFFASYTAIPPHNLPCMPFHSAHLYCCIITSVRLLYPLDPSVEDPDWTPAVAREATALEDVLDRLGAFFDEADRSCAGGQRRARYVDQDRTVLGLYRDKIRWIREWCVSRTRPESARLPHGSGQGQSSYRSEEVDGNIAGGGGGAGGSENGGTAMDVEYASGVLPQQQMMDDGFWEALFEWSWNGNGGMGDYGMEVQAGA